MIQNTRLEKPDFEALSEFRYQLRRFLRFSEDAAQAAGITPLQYLLLLHIKGFPGREWATVGELADRLQAQHHGAVALISRCEKVGLVTRSAMPDDRRQVRVSLTDLGEKHVRHLARLHKDELRSFSNGFQIARTTIFDQEASKEAE